jgi:hypothetical protein
MFSRVFQNSKGNVFKSSSQPLTMVSEKFVNLLEGKVETAISIKISNCSYLETSFSLTKNT